MKYHLILVLVFFFCQRGISIISYDLGDELFVLAESGLNLRAEGKSSSKIITKILFSESVLSMGVKTGYDYKTNSTKIKDVQKIDEEKTVSIILQGTWIKIEYKEFEGYVFDAYLSKMKPPKVDEYFSIFDYFKEEMKILRFIEKRDSTLDFGKNKIILENGSFLEENFHSGGGWYNMTVPDFSTEEALFIIRRISKHAIQIIQKSDGEIQLIQDLGGYRIKSFESFIIISGEWSC